MKILYLKLFTYFHLIFLGIILSSCNVPIKNNYYTCNPFDTNACPAGWTCQLRGTSGIYKCYHSGDGYCGNGILDEGEECDGLVLSQDICSEGYPICLSNCKIYCTECGNGKVEINVNGEGEECDDGNTDNNDGCSSRCKLERSYCQDYKPIICENFCGDEIINGPEVCDGTNFGDYSCKSFGFYDGTLNCSNDCKSISSENCTGFCGDGILDEGEECDGLEQNGEFCIDYASDYGYLSCNAWCQKTNKQCFKFWEKQKSNTYNDLFDILYFDSNNIFASGEKGTILFYDGFSWSISFLSQNSYINKLWGTSPTSVYALSTMGELFYYNGISWNIIKTFNNFYPNIIWGTDENNIYVAGYGNTIKHYDGNTWTDTHHFTENTLIYDIWGTDENNIYAVGENGIVLHYDGSIWTTTLIPDTNKIITKIQGINSNDYNVAGYHKYTHNAFLYHFNGTTYEEIDLSSFDLHYISSLKYNQHGDLFILENSGYILKYTKTNNEITIFQNLPYTSYYNDFEIFSLQNKILLVGNNGLIIKYNGSWEKIINITTDDNLQMYPNINGGISVVTSEQVSYYNNMEWLNTESVNITEKIKDLWVYENDYYLLVFDVSSFIFKVLHKHTGQNWHQIWSSSQTISISKIWGLDNNHIYIVGQYGLMYKYDGTSWNKIYTGTINGLFDIWGTSPNNIYIVGENGTILHYDGNQITSIISTTTHNLYSILGFSENNIYIVGQEGTILNYDGTNWIQRNFIYPVDLNSIVGYSNSDLYVASVVGLLFHFDGITWSPLKINYAASIKKIVLENFYYLYTLTDHSILKYNVYSLSLQSKRCNNPLQIYCNSEIIGNSNINSFNSYSDYGLNNLELGNENFYYFESPITGNLQITLNSSIHDIFVYNKENKEICDNILSPLYYDNSEVYPKTLNIPIVKGEYYFIIIDSKDNLSSSFDFIMQIDCFKF